MKLKFCFVLTRWDDFFLSEITGKPIHVTNAIEEPWESISNKHRLDLGRWSGSDRSRINSLKDSTMLISCRTIEFAANSKNFVTQQWISAKHRARLFLAAREHKICFISSPSMSWLEKLCQSYRFFVGRSNFLLRDHKIGFELVHAPTQRPSKTWHTKKLRPTDTFFCFGFNLQSTIKIKWQLAETTNFTILSLGVDWKAFETHVEQFSPWIESHSLVRNN